MNLMRILGDIEIQSEYKVVIYNEIEEQRYLIEENCNFTKTLEIKYMYVENDILFIELSWEHFISSIECEKETLENYKWFFYKKI